MSKAWILILPLVWLFLVDRSRPSLSPARHGGLWVGALTGIVIAAVIGATYWFVGRGMIDVNEMRQAAERNGIGTPLVFLGVALYWTLINSLLEEYVWRWFVFRQSEIVMGSKLAVVVSSLLFTAHHVIALKAQTGWSVTLLASFGVFIGGIVWSWCYLKFRSIWPGYVSHVIVDAAVYLVGWTVLFGSPTSSSSIPVQHHQTPAAEIQSQQNPR